MTVTVNTIKENLFTVFRYYTVYKYMVQMRRLRWLGHVRRMDAGRFPKDLLNGELVESYRKTGHPELRLKDTCKRDVVKCSIDPNTWECQAEDRSAWRVAIRQGTTCADSERNETAVQKRSRRKRRPRQPSAFDVPTAEGIDTLG